jgi:glycosyltransferase involved in cell wall biosynthesis
MEEKIKLNLTGVNLHKGFSKQDMGYPTAAANMAQGFVDNGFHLSNFDLNSKVNLSFATPHQHIMFSGAYNISYSSHETTEISDYWAECLNKADEVWAASTWTADVFRKKVDKPINVYPHGVSGKFVPAKRKLREDKFFFLHTGEPYIRKGGQVAVEAFLEEFADNEDVIMIIKAYDRGHTILVDDGTGKKVAPEVAYKNVKTIKQSLGFNDYLKMLHNTHCLVYPSWGEGFGMMPLEAMATGLPTITTWEWAEYKDSISHKIESDLVDVPDGLPDYLQDTYLGKIYLPKIDSVRYNMREVYNNREQEFQDSFNKSIDIHKEWNWEDVTARHAVPRIKEIYGDLNARI